MWMRLNGSKVFPVILSHTWIPGFLPRQSARGVSSTFVIVLVFTPLTFGLTKCCSLNLWPYLIWDWEVLDWKETSGADSTDCHLSLQQRFDFSLLTSGSGGSSNRIDSSDDTNGGFPGSAPSYGRRGCLSVMIACVVVDRDHSRGGNHRWDCECGRHGAGGSGQQLHLLPEEEVLLQYPA